MLLGRGIVKDMGEEPGETLKKIYVDTSGTADVKMLELAIDIFGEDRVLWGSDFPANREIKASIDAVNALSLKPPSKQKILHENLDKPCSVFNPGFLWLLSFTQKKVTKGFEC